MQHQFIRDLDGWIIVIASLAAMNTAILGNFLVLRKLSMLGDAISHAILPGLALAFLIFASRDSTIMLIFASLFGILTVVLSEALRTYARVDEGAALGVVFVSLFALGLVLIVHAAEVVDLDASCVLFGSVELAALSKVPVTLYNGAVYNIPVSAIRLTALLLINSFFVFVLYKELVLSSFDERFAKAQDRRPALLHYSLLSLVALTAVISFEVVGNILVVAMFVVPPACAHLLSNRLRNIIWISLFLAIALSAAGHLAAIYLPSYFGFGSISTAGMIASSSGVLFLILLFFGPRDGVLTRLFRLFRMRIEISIDDYLGDLYRIEETRSAGGVSELKSAISVNSTQFYISRLLGFIKTDSSGLHLSPTGKARAESIIRNHRLWELYLNQEAGVTPEQVHSHADGFEHFTSPTLQGELKADTQSAKKDPHGKIIP